MLKFSVLPQFSLLSISVLFYRLKDIVTWKIAESSVIANGRAVMFRV